MGSCADQTPSVAVPAVLLSGREVIVESGRKTRACTLTTPVGSFAVTENAAVPPAAANDRGRAAGEDSAGAGGTRGGGTANTANIPPLTTATSWTKRCRFIDASRHQSEARTAASPPGNFGVSMLSPAWRDDF